MNPNIILIGAPGSGKGTQSAKLINKFSYVHVSTGDILREQISLGTDLGKRVSSILAAGNLVDDSTVMELINSKCDLSSAHYIFDGFPRNLDQAKLLDSFLSTSVNKHFAIHFKVDIPNVVSRISQRRVCSKCGQVYSLQTTPSAESTPCSKCNGVGTIIQRKDDMPEVVENRLTIFANTIQPMLDYYQSKNMLNSVDASLPEDIVFKKISELIENFKVN